MIDGPRSDTFKIKFLIPSAQIGEVSVIQARHVIQQIYVFIICESDDMHVVLFLITHKYIYIYIIWKREDM